MIITRAAPANRTEYVVEQLTAAILGGEVALDQPLPPERLLAEQFGVSRNVVREAAKILQSRGLVTVRQGIGTIVQGLTTEPMQRVISQGLVGRGDPLLKLLEVRLTLEAEIVALAASRRTRTDLNQMEKRLASFEVAMAEQDLFECARLDVAFHEALARATKNEVFVLMLDSLSGLLLESRKRALQNSTLELAARHHRAIYAAVVAKDARDAAAQMRLHLNTSLQETRAWLKNQSAQQESL